MRLTIEVSEGPPDVRVVQAGPQPAPQEMIAPSGVPAGAFDGGADTLAEPAMTRATQPPSVGRPEFPAPHIGQAAAAGPPLTGAPAGAIPHEEYDSPTGDARSGGPGPSPYGEMAPSYGTESQPFSGGIPVNIEPGAGPVIG